MTDKQKDKHKWVGGYRLGHPKVTEGKYKVIADCGHQCLGHETRIRGDGTTLCPDCVPTFTGALR